MKKSYDIINRNWSATGLAIAERSRNSPTHWPYLSTECPLSESQRAEAAMARAMGAPKSRPVCCATFSPTFEYCEAVCGVMDTTKMWQEIANRAACALAKSIDRARYPTGYRHGTRPMCGTRPI